MATSTRVKSVRELRFRKNDGAVFPLDIPQDLNQKLLNKAIRNEYLVKTFATGRSLAESEVCTLRLGNDIAGFLIPGQAILSPDQRYNSDPFFGTYSLIVAMDVCENSFEGNYCLSPHSMTAQHSKSTAFQDDIFYLVVWLKKLKVSAADFADDYFVSLTLNGLSPCIDGKKPLETQRTLESYDRFIQLSKNSKWPAYVRTILSELEPYAADPFLRFFYLYQVIEALMSENYKTEFAKIRQSFDANVEISITQLREYIEQFQKTYKEKSRINIVLQPVCAQSQASAKLLLDALGESHESVTFGELIYKVRNIIFHDYQRAHPFADLVAELEGHLVSYILEKKLI